MLNRWLSRFRQKLAEPRDRYGLYLYVRCRHCGAPVMIRADRRYDLQRDEAGAFLLRKEVMDSRCLQPFLITVHFDGRYRIRSWESEGGDLITWEEYKQLTGVEPR